MDKMLDILNDSNTYRKIQKDPSKKLITKINNLVKSWLDLDIIDEHTYKHLKCTDGNLPRCYGLPKVHKSDFPLRIIVSSIGSATYIVAKFLSDILNESVKNLALTLKTVGLLLTKFENVPLDQMNLSFH